MECAKWVKFDLPKKWDKDSIISAAEFAKSLLQSDCSTEIEIFDKKTAKQLTCSSLDDFCSSVSPNQDFKALDLRIIVASITGEYISLQSSGSCIKASVGRDTDTKIDTAILALQKYFTGNTKIKKSKRQWESNRSPLWGEIAVGLTVTIVGCLVTYLLSKL